MIGDAVQQSYFADDAPPAIVRRSSAHKIIPIPSDVLRLRDASAPDRSTFGATTVSLVHAMRPVAHPAPVYGGNDCPTAAATDSLSPVEVLSTSPSEYGLTGL
ncbi:hypothetical protein [Lewinella sp. IMCC34183]|uniref:hypothetical protein n=1 Tax=Lewinella sp. IMCC34183 TaxID=2248762 RepID=UPI001300BD78|nr:hypothetical protein [Lewinella sp. IMCC34183]